MKREINMRSIFWSSTVFLFAINIVGIILFRNNIRLSTNSLIAMLIFVVLFIRGIFAYTSKNDQYLLLKRHVSNKFNKYNWPSQQQLKDFYIEATLYFAILPFYLPLAAFSSQNVHTLWCLLLLFISQFALVGIEIRKILLERKERKIKDTILEKEKTDQEKHEELGCWK